MQVAISIIFGGLITVLTAIGVEYLRTPRLSLAIGDPALDLPASDGKNMRRNLRLVHTGHPLGPLPAKGSIDLCKVGVKWCYDACHHEKDFTPCEKCHS